MKNLTDNKLLVFCETLKDPIGIDNLRPRFSWHPDSERELAPQKNYHIRVFDGEICVWDSGEVESEENVAVSYDGGLLHSFREYRFTVSGVLTDNSLYTGEGRFEMGILSREAWQGEFLCHPAFEQRRSPVFVSRLRIEKKVKKARAYFCGLGYGELYINGQKTDDSLLDPAWTDYTERVLYRTLDVTDKLEAGENKLRILLGDGWMGHNHKYFEASRKPPLPWYHEPCFLLNLRVEYEDGEVFTFVPDENSCRVNYSEILSQNLFDGEVYDACRAKELALSEGGELLEVDGWLKPQVTQIGARLSAQIMPPIKETEVIRPIHVASTDSSTYTVDVGINFAGVVRIRVMGVKGSSVQFRHTEVAREDGTVNGENLRYAQACDTYILSGESEGEVYMPRFTYHGFRFVEVKLIGRVKILEIEGVRLNSAVERIGFFSCDDPMLNDIYRMLINTEINNLHSLPTDCPQRDERLAWLNDAMMRLEQNVMNFDSQLFFEKWLRDMRDTQQKIGTGAVPDTCPYYYGLSPARWNASVFVALPYALYLYYGDRRTVEEHWDSILWYMEFQRSKLTDDGLIDEFYVGEWCPPMKDSILEDKQSAFARDIKNQLATSCFYYLECVMCQRMAILLGRSEQAKAFRESAERVKQAINAKYFDREKGAYVPECQGNTILPLYLGIVPEEYESAVAQKLRTYVVEKDGYHISTGSHTTRFLFETLTKIGSTDLALEMLRVKSYPSFGYMLENGATSLWERWEKSFGFMTSHNHPMSGGFGVWFLKVLGGIRVDTEEGQGTVLIAPHVPKKLKSVRCKRRFRNGVAVCNWYKTDGELHFDIKVPWNTRAEAQLPLDGARLSDVEINGERLDASAHRYSITDGLLRIESVSGYLHVRIKNGS
ncbi:MAG: family 78 glycoside hydrolase catalytic domain [Clostridia bacterium]|nr:family 78 glycoside hydrolase catalytic domain [Clostridia bacterium]